MELFDDSDEDRVRAPPEDGDPDRRENFGDEAELQNHSQAEGKPVPVKKIVKRPRLKLDAQRLSSERGLPALRKTFENVKFKGKGHEVEDLKLIMKNMEHWAHRLFPKMQFDDIIDRMEVLGSKREVQNCLKKIRLDIPVFDEDYRTTDHDNDDAERERLNNSLDGSGQPIFSVGTPRTAPMSIDTPAPMSSTPVPQLTDEQRERIERNRRLAMERRIAKLQSADVPITSSQSQEKESPSLQDERDQSVTDEKECGDDIVLGATQDMDMDWIDADFAVPQTAEAAQGLCTDELVTQNLVAEGAPAEDGSEPEPKDQP